MDLGLVVTTLGRIDPLKRLLGSLRGQLAAGDRLVIVAQERAPEVEALAAAYRGTDFAITVTTSERGASLGRNTGVAHLHAGEFLLLFPNDTTWFPAGSIAALREYADDTDAGALTVIDENGPKFKLPAPETPLDRWNVWSVIEMGLLLRRTVFDELGGFDSGIGTGAQTPWQAGEATDLLLRLLARRPDLAGRFRWLPDDVAVGGVADARGLSTSERRRKLRAYGRGLGRVVMRHPYPWWWRCAFVGGGLAFGLRHRATNVVADGGWVFLGRAEGALGRTIGTARAAVSR
ncbi:glycosyltransferase family 2 protein [Microbacterium sp. ZW CA_36]|uniref:glycosyltransferase family 2 protein n=1 Tax=Microbacterium sp. ZW CA_36 TaxID=3378078 RepID=UPI0038552EE5